MKLKIKLLLITTLINILLLKNFNGRKFYSRKSYWKISTSEFSEQNYITNQEFKKFTAENFTGRLAQANLASKSDIANFVKKDRLK